MSLSNISSLWDDTGTSPPRPTHTLPLAHTNTEEEAETVLESEGRTPGKQVPLKQHEQSSYEVTELRQLHRAGRGPHQIFCIYIMAFRLVLLWDSCVCKWLSLWFLNPLLGSFPSVVLSCPTLKWYFCIFLIYLFAFLRKKWIKF